MCSRSITLSKMREKRGDRIWKGAITTEARSIQARSIPKKSEALMLVTIGSGKGLAGEKLGAGGEGVAHCS